MKKEGRVFQKNIVINKIEEQVERDIHIVAAHYFSRNISAEDELFLHEWLKASPENAQILDELRKVWELTGDLKQTVAVDVDNEWDSFIALRDKPKQIRLTSFLYNKVVLRVAAVLLPLLIVSTAYFYWNKTQPIEMAVITTQNDKSEFVLSDGTKVWLNKNSKFEYPKHFAANERRVKLEGEAYFEVNHSGTPFFIETKQNRVQVLGTIFNVRAYNNDSIAQVSVKQGKVSFASKAIDTLNTILIAGQSAQYNINSKALAYLPEGDINAFAWKDNRLKFSNLKLTEASKSIEHYFGVEIVGSESIMNCRFSGEFNNPHLSEVLSTISMSIGATFSLQNDTVYLKIK